MRRLQLSAKRLVFLTETLAEIAEHRQLNLLVGDPTELLRGEALAATFAPVPGYAKRSAQLDVVEEHPWPWLVQPREAKLSSFSAWRRSVGR